MRFKADEIVSVLQSEIQQYENKLDTREVGRVLEVGDGIARVYGLANAMNGEMVEFSAHQASAGSSSTSKKTPSASSSSAIIWTSSKGTRCARSARSCKCRSAMPSSAGSSIRSAIRSTAKGRSSRTRPGPVEFTAPGVAGRQPVNQPLQTGIKAIDSMTPVGRGQRELIIGDRKTGKTAIAIDTIINQREENVICVYVAIGQKESQVASIVEALRANGAMDYTIVVVASAADAAPLQYLAPYAGTAMAEYYMYEQGRDTLCVYDDLSKQAAAYRQLSLLMPSSAGPRGVSGRHLLLPFALARTLRQVGRALGHRARRFRCHQGQRQVRRQRQSLRRPAR